VQGIYTDIGQRPSEIDANWFRGSLQDLYTLAGAKAPVPTKYIVKAGDTFSSIAAQNNLTLDDLLAANPNLVQVGAQLDIPAPILVVPPPVVTPPVVTPPVVTPPVVTPPIVKPPVVTPLVVTPTTPDPIPSGPIQYTIQPGDSLTRIAAKYGVTVDAIARANNISNPNLIQVGQKLIIPKP
jgi:LysM repeat protein